MDEEGDRTKGEVDDLRDADERATKEKAGQSPKRYCGKKDFFKDFPICIFLFFVLI